MKKSELQTPVAKPWVKVHPTKPSAAPLPPHLSGRYDGAELRDNSRREGAYDFRKWPSRIGNMRVWRDGRTEEITE